MIAETEGFQIVSDVELDGERFFYVLLGLVVCLGGPRLDDRLCYEFTQDGLACREGLG